MRGYVTASMCGASVPVSVSSAPASSASVPHSVRAVRDHTTAEWPGAFAWEGAPLKTLILMVGLPRSGKSTQAAAMFHPIVCPDAIRLALHGKRFEALAEPFVWAIARVMVRALFLAGHDTLILDACNVTSQRRLEWSNGGEWEVRYFPVLTSKSECIRRARLIGDTDIIPVIERMYQQWDLAEAEVPEFSHPENGGLMIVGEP